jgi:hypothetical protein
MSLIILLAIIALLLGIAGMAKPAWNPYAHGTALILLAICFIIGAAGPHAKLF